MPRALTLVAATLLLGGAAWAQKEAEPVPVEPPPNEPVVPRFEQPPLEPPSEPPPAEPAPVAPDEVEPSPPGDKRPLRLYQTKDGVSILSNRDDDSPEPPVVADAAPPRPALVQPAPEEPRLEAADLAPLPSARPLAPAASAEPPSRGPLFALAAAVGIVALAIIGIFFRRR